MNPEIQDVVIVGGGQAALATGYHLQNSGLRFSILEQSGRVGNSWRSRWDSLQLFTPARYSALPGLPFPASGGSYPAKDQFADYLESYADRFRLPVRTHLHVESVRRASGRFEVRTSEGTLHARSVVAAPGHTTTPRIPVLAEKLDPGITQLHSSRYRGPGALPAGDVVVVGAGTSGAQIAQELAGARPAGTVYLAGSPTAHIPDAVFRFAGPVYWRLVNSLLTLDTKPGRKAAAGFHDRGSPLIQVSMRDVERAGVIRLPRFTGVADGQPVFDGGEATAGARSRGGSHLGSREGSHLGSRGGTTVGGTTVDGTTADGTEAPRTVRTIIWATGYRPEFDWIEGLPLDAHGWPATVRGSVPELPGLYFVGMPFQYALTSGLIGGMGRDAAHVVAELQARKG